MGEEQEADRGSPQKTETGREQREKEREHIERQTQHALTMHKCCLGV